MATGKALDGKPYAGNPHVRFDEGEVALAATPRRGSLLYKMILVVVIITGLCMGCETLSTAVQDSPTAVQDSPTDDKGGLSEEEKQKIRESFKEAIVRLEASKKGNLSIGF